VVPETGGEVGHTPGPAPDRSPVAMSMYGPVAADEVVLMTTMDVTPLRHDALFYDGVGDLVDRLAPFVLDGLDRGDAVVAVLPPPNLAALRGALGRDGTGVDFIDASEWYRRPVPTIDRYHRSLLAKQALGHPAVRVIGEVQFGAAPDDWRAWTKYEAAINRAFASWSAWIICPYSARTLPAEVLADAERTHAHIHAGGRRSTSTPYQPAERVIVSLAVPPGAAGDPALSLDLSEAPHRARVAVAGLARQIGFDRSRIAEVALCVAEVVANAHLHGGGPVTLRAWAGAGRLICEVADGGSRDVDPLAGYLPPDPHRVGGRGLWIARHLADQVELVRRDDGGLSAWLRFSPASLNTMPG
jgi:anti-sigma regulatory factor (Ser/Thr protein kinase)